MLYMIDFSSLGLRKDKGYAWVILASSFLSHCLHLGFSFAVLGNLTIAHEKVFSISLEQASAIGSVHVGLFFLLAPLASLLIKKLGCRVTQLIGGACLIAGLGLSSVSTRTWHAYIFFGIIAAWGVSCCYVASSEILSLYFKRYRYLAFALAVLGYFVGMVAWPNVSQNLLDQYGYSKAMGYMACLHVMHIIAGILFFTPQVELEADPDADENGVDNEAYIESKESNNYQHEEEEQSAVAKFISDLKNLLVTPKVWALLLSSMLWNCNITSFLVLINEHIIKALSIDEESAALGITFIGVANIVGTIIVMLISRLSYDRLILHMCCPAVYGICTIVIGYSESKEMYYVIAAIWGLAQGCHIANLLAVVYDFAGGRQLVVLFGINLFFQGVGSIVGTPISALLSSHQGTAGLIFSGVSGLLSSVIILAAVINKYRMKEKASSGALKAIVLAGRQQRIINSVIEAAGPEYPSLGS